MDDLLNRAPCGFLSFADDGLIVQANATLAEMLGQAPDSLPGRPLESILTLPSRIFYQTHFFPLLRIQGEAKEVYMTLRGSGGDLPVMVNAVRRERDGSPANDCVLVVMQQRGEYENAILDAKRAADEAVREREQAVERLEAAKQELQEHQAELERLNSRLKRAMTETHHRVKNNLQIICALIEMQTGEGKEWLPVSEWLRLETNIRALSAIHDILTQEAKEGSDQESLSSREVLQKLIDLLSQTMGDRKLHADLEDARISPRQATGLALITSELISNALKHSKSDIRVDFDVLEEEALLVVSDDGPGFPPGFDPAKSANTGLGLIGSVGQWDLGGEVEFTNRPEGGAAVIVRFPLRTRVATA